MRKEKKLAAETAAEEVVSIKGFDRRLKCRGFQYEIGASYAHDGNVEACGAGFHAIEGHPFEVFNCYAPATSRYAEVKQSGAVARHGGDSKVASARIAIGVELHLHELIQRAVKWVFDHAKPEDTQHSAGYQGAASSTGDYGAASSTGYQGAASSTGYYGAALAAGYQGKAMGAEGNALFLVHRDDDCRITHAWAGIAGKDGIKPHTWYTLNTNGQPEEVRS